MHGVGIKWIAQGGGYFLRCLYANGVHVVSSFRHCIGYLSRVDDSRKGSNEFMIHIWYMAKIFIWLVPRLKVFLYHW